MFDRSIVDVINILSVKGSTSSIAISDESSTSIATLANADMKHSHTFPCIIAFPRYGPSKLWIQRNSSIVKMPEYQQLVELTIGKTK